MTIAAQARDAALQLEVKKDGLQQRQNGAWVLRLSVHPNDMPMEVMKAPMGTRFVCVLVEIDENEEPKGGDAHAQLQSVIDTPPVQPREVGRASPEKRLAQRAGKLCNDPVFRLYMAEQFTVYPNRNLTVDEAAHLLREVCGVGSRADIIPDTPAGDKFEKIYSRFIAWRDVPAEVA
jgi:hypothetical protein